MTHKTYAVGRSLGCPMGLLGGVYCDIHYVCLSGNKIYQRIKKKFNQSTSVLMPLTQG